MVYLTTDHGSYSFPYLMRDWSLQDHTNHLALLLRDARIRRMESTLPLSRCSLIYWLRSHNLNA